MRSFRGPIRYHCVPCAFRTNSISSWAKHLEDHHPDLADDPHKRQIVSHADVAAGSMKHGCPICGTELVGPPANLVKHIDREHPFDDVAPPYPDFVVERVITSFERHLAFERYCEERRAA